MRVALLIARRELAGYAGGLGGFVVLAAALLIEGILFNTFALDQPDRVSSQVLELFFRFSSVVTILASVAVSMRLLAEERQVGTMVLYDGSPALDGEVVAGKFLSAVAFLAVLQAASFYMPLLIYLRGSVSPGHVLAGYLGLLLLGSACAAIGLFASSLARTQVLAAIVGSALIAGLLLTWLLARVTEPPLSTVLEAIGLHGLHFAPFGRGIIHMRDVVYYLAVTYLALFAATRVLEARRWR